MSSQQIGRYSESGPRLGLVVNANATHVVVTTPMNMTFKNCFSRLYNILHDDILQFRSCRLCDTASPVLKCAI